MSAEASIAFETLRRGQGEEIPVSPVAAFLLDTLGEEKVSRLFALAEKHLHDDDYRGFLRDARHVLGPQMGPLAGALEKSAAVRLRVSRELTRKQAFPASSYER